MSWTSGQRESYSAHRQRHTQGGSVTQFVSQELDENPGLVESVCFQVSKVQSVLFGLPSALINYLI